MHPSPSRVVFLAGLVNCVLGARRPTLPRPDPFADPKHDPYNPLQYIASNALTAVAFSLFVVTAFIQTWWVKKYGTKWMLAMVIGAYTFAFGIGTRFGLTIHPQSKGIYIVQYLFVVLSPCAFIAANYVLLGRLSRYLQCDQHLLVPAKRITLVFIMSDVITFLIQAAGGAVSISANDLPLAKVGSNIFLAGLAIQLFSFLVFTCVFLLFLLRVHKNEPQVWTKDNHKPWHHSWHALAVALLVSCIGILIRSVFRTVELSEGFRGHLATNEAFFYGLDTLPLFLAVVVYVPFWPGRFIPAPTVTIVDAAEKVSESGST